MRVMGGRGSQQGRRAIIGTIVAGMLLATITASPAAAAAESRSRPSGSAGYAKDFTGSVEDFYRVPVPLRSKPPGHIIRTQLVGNEDGATTTRVMYHSRDRRGRDRAVTGIITYPTSAAPKGGWPVVAWAHGTTGLASQCAPSRAGAAAPAFGVDGVRVATDYIGLGPIGERHPYLSGRSEAHSVIDAVRAARRLAPAHASRRWVALGHSQGGHAALFTNQLGRRYAPELKLQGTVAIAPASELARTFGPADQVVPRMVGIMGLYGLAADYPRVDPDDYIGAEVKAREGVIDTGCLDDIVNALVTIPADSFYSSSPLTTEPARSVLLANDPGHVRVKSPLLVVYGTTDTFVVPDRAVALFDRLCSVGQVTQLVKVDGADHGTVPRLAGPTIASWLNDRLRAAPAPNTCPDLSR